MNRYQAELEHCLPPEGFEARLRTGVLAAAARQPAAKPYRPPSFARKLLLAALIALTLTVTVSAAVLAVPWDQIFLDRFGSDEKTAVLGEAAFQDVNVSAVCGDTTLTIRQAMGDEKTIYLILDIDLPDTVPLAEAIAEAGNPVGYHAAGEFSWAGADASNDAWLSPPTVRYYATSAYSWADIQDKSYAEAEILLKDSCFPGGSFGSLEERGYDAETNTLTYLLSFTTGSTSKNLTDQALTLLVGGMSLVRDEVETELFSGPFLISFEPAYTAQAQTLNLSDDEGNPRGRVMISPFAFYAEVWYGGYTSFEALMRDIKLIYTDDSVRLPPRDLGWGGGGSRPGDSKVYNNISVNFRFKEILDLSTVKAVRIGDLEARLD